MKAPTYKTQVAPFLEGALKVSDAAAPVFGVPFRGVLPSFQGSF